MSTDEDRCAEAKRLQRISEAFGAGDLNALRAAVPDRSHIPNGPAPLTIGSWLVNAIYHSPRPFIRQLLDLGADPNAPADDGFPPLIAALSCTRSVPGSKARPDVVEIVRTLLRFGADPNQRGINDWTALHMAVAERNALAVQLLLEAGADPDARTRIDDCETALEMARAADLIEIGGILERRGGSLNQRLRPGLVMVLDIAGAGEPVRRQHSYRVRFRLRLQNGDPVRFEDTWSSAAAGAVMPTVEDDGEALVSTIRVERRSLVNGIFYGMDGMRVGGTRRLQIAPHLAYGEKGVPGRVPPNAVLLAEIAVLGDAATSEFDRRT